MKKITAIVICMLMLCLTVVPVFAGSEVVEVDKAVMELYILPQGSELNNAFQMRGFTASPDGKYVYGGFLQAGRLVGRYDAETAEAAGTFKPVYDNDNAYCKGLAVDDRGNLFIGVTHDGTKFISVYAVDGEMKEISHITEELDYGTGKTGINGIAVQKIDGKYLLYAVTAYNADSIRCYDVTDPSDITLYTAFGTNGVVECPDLDSSIADPNYIAVDEEGFIYLTYLKNGGSGKGTTTAKIAKDGKSVVKSVEIVQAYGICEAGDYLFVATYNNTGIHVLNRSDLSAVTTIEVPDGSSLSDIAFGGGYLFVGEHGNNSAAVPGKIYRSEKQIKVAEEAAILYGDCNGDGAIDSKDLVRLRKYLDNLDDETGLSTVEITEGADTNGDGKVDSKDLVRLRKYLDNLDDETGISTIQLGPQN